jgi:dihydroorotate dehydrogenase (fumarate)
VSRFASTKEQLVALYECPFTGAVTTRTSHIGGFAQDDNLHTHVFFGENKLSSINSYGYSPHTLDEYLTWITEIHLAATFGNKSSSKPFIVSVTGTGDEIEACFLLIQQTRKALGCPTQNGFDIAVEINLSCPNVPKKPPPAYSSEGILPYLIVTKRYWMEDPTLTIGVKLPPYTYEMQFKELVSCTWRSRTDQGLSFLTATNTLGQGLVFNDQVTEEAEGIALPPGWGGLGGETIHALAVGNVSKLVSMLDGPQPLDAIYKSAGLHVDESPENKIAIFGVGGINSGKTLNHFLSVGAVAGEVCTAFGVGGVPVFQRILAEYRLLSPSTSN